MTLSVSILLLLFIRCLLTTIIAFALPGVSVLVAVEVWSLGKTSIIFSAFSDFSATMFRLTVLLIAIRVFRFSVYYVQGTPNFSAFHLILLTFVTSILILIFSPNIFSLILGWDGLGISSYFLVIFYKNSKAFNSGLLTGISNRVGDALILISLSSWWLLPNSSILPSQSSSLTISAYSGLVFIVAACTKRAQLPFRAWLPAAIAAPTPVSALVHSSTLVTAGIYLIMRLSNFLSFDRIMILSLVGGITIIIARISAIIETDGKKVVALSTLSQLGVIMCGYATSNPSVVFFHLLVHAFFKALLFIATGVIIHNSGDSQDLRNMGGLYRILPITQSVAIFTKARLIGLPFFAAFYSKEMVLERLSGGVLSPLYSFMMILAGVGLTVIYSARFIFTILLTPTRTSAAVFYSEHSGHLCARVIFLSFPRLISGKVLYFLLADGLEVPVLSFFSKLLPLIIIICFSVFIVLIPKLVKRTRIKYSTYIWGLPLFTGGLPLNSYITSGLHLISMLSFSYIDYIVFSFNIVGLVPGVSTLSSYSANLYLLILSFLTLLIMLIV